MLCQFLLNGFKNGVYVDRLILIDGYSNPILCFPFLSSRQSEVLKFFDEGVDQPVYATLAALEIVANRKSSFLSCDVVDAP